MIIRNKTQKDIKNSGINERRDTNYEFIIIALIVLFILLILSVLLNVFGVQAQATQTAEQNKTTKQDAEKAIKNIEDIMQEMQEAGFNIVRVNDSLDKATQLYEAQKILEEKRKKADYSLILSYEQEIIALKEQALKLKDELFSLEKALESLQEKGINASEAEKMVQQIKQEIKDERYEKALELVPKTREKLSEIEASATTLNIFLKATKRTLTGFFKENYVAILSVICIVIILYLIFKNKLLRAIIKKKIKKLELRKANLERLIKETQREYFGEGKISESLYTIRISKFAELIRDINRQIPLLQEEYFKVSKKKRLKKEKTAK